MWHAPEGETTFTGPFAVALAQCINGLASELETSLDYGAVCEYGHRAFDRLTDEQKIWAIHQVAFGLLDENTEVVPLMAYVEATVATVIRRMEGDIVSEIYLAEDDPDEPEFFSLRRAVHGAYELAGGNSSDMLMDDEEPLRAECADPDEWQGAIEMLETQIFWDYDFDLDVFDDMSPQASGQLKSQHGILDDYFTAVPEDPKRPDAEILLRETRELCDRVIAREEKKSHDQG